MRLGCSRSLPSRFRRFGGPIARPSFRETRTVLSAFTAARAAELPGPDWLRALRAAAVERYEAAPAPSSIPESWRYSPIGEIDLESFAPASAAGGEGVPARKLAGAAATIVVRNGSLVSADINESAGVTVTTNDELPLLVPPEPDALTHLHDAFVPEVVVVRIAAGAVVDGAILIENVIDGEDTISFPHVVVDAGAQSEATVVEWSTSSDARLFVDPVTELHVGAAANLRFISLQDLGGQTWQTGHVLTTIGRDATLKAWVLSIGAAYGRTYVAATMAGQGGSAHIAGVYFGDEQQVHDVRSLQDHVGIRSISDFQLKGAVVDEARGVYTGLIRVQEGAKATESFLGNRNLVLSDGAHVDAVPNLEILNENDIRSCGHAAATGPVDEEHLFYLESLGIPTDAAQRLIVSGFFDDVLNDVPVAEVRDAVRADVARKLAKAKIAVTRVA